METPNLDGLIQEAQQAYADTNENVNEAQEELAALKRRVGDLELLMGGLVNAREACKRAVLDQDGVAMDDAQEAFEDAMLRARETLRSC